MNLLKSLSLTFVGIMSCVLLMSVGLVPNKHTSSNKAPFELVTSTKTEKVKMTDAEARAAFTQKIIQKKIQKLEKKNEKRVAEGKAPKAGKSWMVALLLALFLGLLGIHRFYLGYMWQGVVQLLTGGGFFIWAFIDFIRIAIRDLGPLDGEYVD